MASPTIVEFKQFFSEFCQLTETQLEPWFTQAALRWRADRFGTQWHMVVYLYTAHQLSVLGTPGKPGTGAVAATSVATGALKSERIGDLSASYADAIDKSKVPVSMQPYLRTAYGVELVGLLLSRAATRGRVVRTGSSRVGAVPNRWDT